MPAAQALQATQEGVLLIFFLLLVKSVQDPGIYIPMPRTIKNSKLSFDVQHVCVAERRRRRACAVAISGPAPGERRACAPMVHAAVDRDVCQCVVTFSGQLDDEATTKASLGHQQHPHPTTPSYFLHPKRMTGKLVQV